MLGSLDTVTIPPEALRERVTASKDVTWFIDSGARTVAEWLAALALSGVPLATCGTIVDFGCGCGRALLHLAPMLTPSQTLVGLDTDADAVGWVTTNISGVQAAAIGTMPPAPLTTGSVDLIFCHSVFTHLPEDVQHSWLHELARMLRPGGILIASVHGEKVEYEYRASLLCTSQHELAVMLASAMAGKGFFHVTGRTAAEGSFPAYYGAAFHRVAYVVRHWLDEFDLVKWLPVHALNHQDVFVLRRKSAA